MVTQQAYSDGQIPISSDHPTPRGWDGVGVGVAVGVPETSEPDSGRYSPLLNRLQLQLRFHFTQQHN